MEETLFDELKRYVGFGPAEERALHAFHPIARPHFTRISEVFYDRILTHEGARTALEGGESTVGRLKVTLVAWMDKLLTGPWDEAYYQLRCRIGRVHVKIALPQHYMFGAMNVLRRELNSLADEHYRSGPEWTSVRFALNKILDLELAIMLHTYREDLLAQASKSERLATFGQLVGSIGHELRNPLGVIETSLYILKGRVAEDERAQKHISRISEQLGVANGIITSLLDMIRDRPLQRNPVELAQVVDSAASVVTRGPNVSLTISGIDTLPPVPGDAQQLRQIFVNLLENASHASGPAGEVKVEGRVDGNSVMVAVEDRGPGVDEATRRRLFEPLVTTKEKGLGLGLALVRRMAERHGGTIGYEPATPRGARFVLRLPLE